MTQETYRHNDPLTPDNHGANNQANADLEIDVRALLLMLWRRKWIVISAVVIGLTLASLFVSSVTPRFTAKTLVLIEVESSASQAAIELGALMGGMNHDASLVFNEIEIIKSRNMSKRVVERLDLMSDPEFNPNFAAIEKSRKETSTENQSSNGFKSLSVSGTEMEIVDQGIARLQMEAVINNYLKRLKVFSIGASNGIQIEFVSHNPIKAARIANAIADVYIEQRLETKFKSAQKISNWLDRRLKDLRDQVRTAEQAVVDYRAEFKIAEGTRTITSTEEISQLNAQLVSAKAKLAENQARLEQVNRAANDETAMASVSEIVNSPLIQQLKRQQAELEGRLSDASTRYGPRHPQIIQLTSEITELQNNKRSEMLRIADTIRSEVKFAEARVKALSDGLAEAKGQRLEDNTDMIRLGELEREAASTRLIFDTFLQSYKRSDSKEELEEAEARIISYASPPQIPSYPNSPLMISLSGALSLMIGLALAVLLEKLDNAFRSASQLEKVMKYPCFAMIPNIDIKDQRELIRYILSRPSSTLAESVRTLRTVLKLRKNTDQASPKIVTITSSFPGEGKTTLSTWLGLLTAKSDEKVILIDADLRRPNVHRSLGMVNDVTLVDYLTDQKDLSQVIQKDENSGLDLILGRSVPNSALDLVSSKKMAALIEELSSVYDLIIIDSPACLAVSDARILANLSDHTVYAVGWDKTPREVVMSGVKQFTDMNYQNLSFVLSNVDVKKHVNYGYGDSVYYYGKHQEYYAN